MEGNGRLLVPMHKPYSAIILPTAEGQDEANPVAVTHEVAFVDGETGEALVFVDGILLPAAEDPGFVDILDPGETFAQWSETPGRRRAKKIARALARLAKAAKKVIA